MLVSAEAREQRQMAAVEQRPCHKLVSAHAGLWDAL